MDLTGNKAVIISAGVNGWYPAGVRRLVRTLNFEGWGGSILTWEDYPPNCPKHDDIPYYIKIAAFEEAIKQGYTHILWVDSSFWAIKNPMPIFDLISDKGVVGFRTGYNMAETSSDAALNHFGFTRDEAELLPEIASGLCGIRTDNPDGKKVYELWKESMDLGLSRNNRVHDINDSPDPRMKFARQDQTLWALSIHKCGLNIDDMDFVAYYNGDKTGYNKEKCIFYIGGI